MTASHFFPARGRIRLGALALAASGVFFLLYVAVRPWHDESTLDGATKSMSSGAWVAAHLFAVVSFILLPLGLLAVRAVVTQTRGEPLAFAAIVVTWIGAGFTLPYYGAEDFGLNAIARRVAAGEQLDLLQLVDAVRYNPAAITTFGIGLVSLGVGAVLAAMAIWRSGVLSRPSGIVFAISYGLLLPQFFLSPALRVGHGVLVAVGLAWIALVVWRARVTPVATSAPTALRQEVA